MPVRSFLLMTGTVLLLLGLEIVLWNCDSSARQESISRASGRVVRSNMPSPMISFDREPVDRQPATQCGTCHELSDGIVHPESHFLNQRAALSEDTWSDTLALQRRCGTCHKVPDPSQAGSREWKDILLSMRQIMHYLGTAPLFEPVPTAMSYREWVTTTHTQWQDVMHYYYVFSDTKDTLGPDPSKGSLEFTSNALGQPYGRYRFPRIGHVNIDDVNGDGQSDVLVSDFNRRSVNWIHRNDTSWVEEPLANVPVPGPAELVDIDEDGKLDIVVAGVGSATPTDKKVGSVQLLVNNGSMNFEVRTVLAAVGRVADVRPGDFDGDGDTDFIVGIFGNWKEGEIGWLEHRANGEFTYHQLSNRAGTVNVSPVDINYDGKLDFVALIAQEHEEIIAFVNRGDGRFEQHLLWKAESPSFGSSGMELVDLDQDGDIDILFTNGDSFGMMIHSYHGVQWLENTGGMNFVYHDIIRFYGAFHAVAGDIDRDDDLDIVAVSLMNDWANPDRKSIIWLENKGNEQFISHGISGSPTSLITASLGDLTGNGLLDIVTGNMHLYEQSHARKARVTVWRNQGLKKSYNSE